MVDSHIPQKCKAAVVLNAGPDFRIEIQEVDVPVPGPDEVLIKLNMTGLCASDVHYCLNDLPLPPMSDFGVRSPGHEGAGVVVKVGANVSSWSVGDRAGIKPMWNVCQNCEACWNGIEQWCPAAVNTGLQVAGTYQQYLTSPARYTTRIPEGVSDEIAAPIMCAASTMHRALVDSRLKAGDFIVFPGGGGGVGIQGVQLAKAMGMRPIVIDTGDMKRDLALKHGAEIFIDFRSTENVAAEVVKAADGKGAHGVIVTAWPSYKDAVSFIGRRIGGTIMCIGLPPKDKEVIVGADPLTYAGLKLNITGSIVGSMNDATCCLGYAQRGLLKQISEVRSLSQLPESVNQLRRGEVVGRIVIDFNKA